MENIFDRKNVKGLNLYKEIFGTYNIDSKNGLDPESRSG